MSTTVEYQVRMLDCAAGPCVMRPVYVSPSHDCARRQFQSLKTLHPSRRYELVKVVTQEDALLW